MKTISQPWGLEVMESFYFNAIVIKTGFFSPIMDSLLIIH